jgi:hypothetical protein
MVCLLVFFRLQDDWHRADLMSDGSKNAGEKPCTKSHTDEPTENVHVPVY